MRNARKWTTLPLLALLAGAGCAGVGTGSGTTVGSPYGSDALTPGPNAVQSAPKAEGRSLAAAKTWTLGAAEAADLSVVLPLAEDSKTPLTPKQVAALKIVKTSDGAAGVRRVLAQISLLAPPPADPKAAKTNFWDAGWQKTMRETLDKLAASGWDGVCLQGVGAWEAARKERATAPADMAAFVETLAARVRKRHANFVVVPENGATLLSALTEKERTAFLSAIDGIVVENTFYAGDKPSDNPLAPQSDVLAALDQFQKAGKPVFAIDYLRDAAKTSDFAARAKARGYVALAALGGGPEVAAAPKLAKPETPEKTAPAATSPAATP